jgi:hypothetical protein
VGTVYSGAYADEIGYDKHEGYAVARDAAGADAGPQIWLAYEDEADHLVSPLRAHAAGAGRAGTPSPRRAKTRQWPSGTRRTSSH